MEVDPMPCNSTLAAPETGTYFLSAVAICIGSFQHGMSTPILLDRLAKTPLSSLFSIRLALFGDGKKRPTCCSEQPLTLKRHRKSITLC